MGEMAEGESREADNGKIVKSLCAKLGFDIHPERYGEHL